MTVLVELAQPNIDATQLTADRERRFKEVLGVRLMVEVVARGGTDQYTGTSKSSKIKRLLGRRNSG